MCSEFYGHDIEFKLAVMKLESSEACLLKLENNSVVEFPSYWNFFGKIRFLKNADVLNDFVPTKI